MRAQLQISGYEIEFDRDATASCYARVHVPGPEACGCAPCRNWIAARKDVLSSEFQNLLSQLGIPTDGEIEVWEVSGQTRPHLYGGWYFIVGRIVSGAADHEFNGGGFQIRFSSGNSFAVSEFEGQQIFEMHFTIETEEYLSKSEYASTPKPKSHSET